MDLKRDSARDGLSIDLDTSIFFDGFFQNASNTSILILSADGTILKFNQRFHQVFGYSEEELLGKNFSNLFIPEDREKKLPEKELESVFKEGSGSDKNFLLNNKGKFIWVVGESVLVKSKDQSYVIKLVYDINEEKKIAEFLAKANDQLIESTNYAKDVNKNLSKANEDLKKINREVDQLSKKNSEQTSFYEMLLSNTADFIYSFDLEGRFTYVNKALLDLWGLKLEDAIGKTFYDLEYPADIAEKHRVQIKTVIETKKPIRDENFYTSRLGKRYYEYIFVPVMEGERVTAVAGTTRDITHRMNLIRELKMKNEELSRINLDLDNFVYTASHDLKAPINNIHALIRFLEDEMTAESKRNSKELLELIYTSIEKFQNTLTDLSTVVRESTGEEGVVKEVSFKDVIEDVTTNLFEVIERTGAAFTFDLKEGSIHFPRKNLRSIIYNLVSNAIKYRSPERKPEIKITSEKMDRYIVLKVSDNGLGIKEEDKAKVFKMFNRLHDHVEGTGVGMAIVARIVDTSGGKIEIDSEVGKGTTFKVYFKVP